MKDKKHTKEVLPEKHWGAYRNIYCNQCKMMVHNLINEIMADWVETREGNYCLACYEELHD